MLWWAKAGADSMDTSSILQNQYFHWLESLEGLSNTPRKKGTHQVTLADGAGTDLKAGDPSNAGDEQ